nr:MAG: ORF1 [Torque teno midi virus]
MPFWWYRRRKPWFGRWRTKRRTTYRKKPRRRRFPRRRRNRRTYRRRRRRHYKVRRKQKKITIKQWQPESIKKCKIKGSGQIVLGAEGTQFRCFTVYKNEWTNPKVATGGGFGVELFTLKYLYKEYKARNNIWTSSNAYRDFCRYTGCYFIFFRHPETDFILGYDIQPPFTITKYTYMMAHPHFLLQRKHKKLLLSTKTKPNGRLTKKLKIKPPKMLQTKWYFQEELADFGLVTIFASACNFRYPWLACCNENLIITLYYLQPSFWTHTEWAQFSTDAYNPTGHVTKLPDNLTYKGKLDNKEYTWTMTPFTTTNKYEASLNKDTGWFNPKVLNANTVLQGGTLRQSLVPCGVLRYNPYIDTGKGNKMWVCSVLVGSWTEPKDTDLIMEDYPLWAMFYGYTSYLKQIKNKTVPFSGSMIVVKSPALYRVFGEDPKDYYPLIDKSFMIGKGTNNTDPILPKNRLWYPALFAQRDSISQIVNCGPYIPKYNETKESTWQCNYFYNFYFKWGGSYPPQQEAENPENKNTYPIPNNEQQTVQIEDPLKQKYTTIFKPWDYRRGNITKTALKRMYENISDSESHSTDSTSSTSPKKKKLLPTLQDPKKENKEIQACLLSLCEDTSYQEPQETQDLFKLIQQQHKQQHQLKLNLLTLISDLKIKQRNLLHQSGFLA